MDQFAKGTGIIAVRVVLRPQTVLSVDFEPELQATLAGHSEGPDGDGSSHYHSSLPLIIRQTSSSGIVTERHTSLIPVRTGNSQVWRF